MKKRKFFDDSLSMSGGRGWLRLSRHELVCGGVWWSGEAITAVGIVAIYRESKVTRLDFVHRRRMWSRTYSDQWLPDRSVAILAGRFAREVVDRSGPAHRGPEK